MLTPTQKVTITDAFKQGLGPVDIALRLALDYADVYAYLSSIGLEAARRLLDPIPIFTLHIDTPTEENDVVHSVQVEVDFGFYSGQEGDIAVVTVLASWVTNTSNIICASMAKSTIDHDPEDAALEDLVAYAINIEPGISFDIQVHAPQNTWGRYFIQAIGIQNELDN